MAKQLWFTTANPTTHRGHTSAKLNGVVAWWSPRLMSESRGSGVVSLPVSTVAGPTVGIEVVESGEFPYEWLTEPLAADFTISGTITVNLWAYESTMNDNASANAVIEKIDGATGAITQIAKTARTTEVAVTPTPTVNNFTVTPTSTVCKRGDRLRIRMFFDDSTSNMAVGSAVFRANGSAASADGDSWIQFTENLTFEPAGNPSGSTYYLTDTAETIDPSVGVEKKALTTRGSGSTNAVTNTPVAVPTAGVAIGAVTFGAFVEWFSPPLAAFTLGGKAKFNIRAFESNAAANASLRADISVCANDGTNPVLWGAACIAPGATFGEIGTADAAYTAWVSGDDTAITAGQRLRFRIHIDDLANAPIVNGHTVTVSYNGDTPNAAGDTYVILPALVTEQSLTPPTTDSATVGLKFTASGSDTYTPTTPTSDSATVGVLLVASGVELKQPTSSGTLYFRLVSMPFYRVVQVIAGNEVTLREFPYTDLADEQARRLEIGIYTRDRYAEGKHVRIYSSKDRGELVHQEDLLVDSDLGDLYKNV